MITYIVAGEDYHESNSLAADFCGAVCQGNCRPTLSAYQLGLAMDASSVTVRNAPWTPTEIEALREARAEGVVPANLLAGVDRFLTTHLMVGRNLGKIK